MRHDFCQSMLSMANILLKRKRNSRATRSNSSVCCCQTWNLRACSFLCVASMWPLQPHSASAQYILSPDNEGPLCDWAQTDCLIKISAIHKWRVSWWTQRVAYSRLSTPGHKESVWMDKLTCGWTLLCWCFTGDRMSSDKGSQTFFGAARVRKYSEKYSWKHRFQKTKLFWIRPFSDFTEKETQTLDPVNIRQPLQRHKLQFACVHQRWPNKVWGKLDITVIFKDLSEASQEALSLLCVLDLHLRFHPAREQG